MTHGAIAACGCQKILRERHRFTHRHDNSTFGELALPRPHGRTHIAQLCFMRRSAAWPGFQVSRMTDQISTFADPFPKATQEGWMKLVDGVLKGKDFAKTLIGKTYDGIAVQPLYPRAEGAAHAGARAQGGAWGVVQRIDIPEAELANAQALDDLENGATGLDLVLAGSAEARGCGLSAETAATFDKAVAGIYLDLCAIRLSGGRRTRAAAASFAAMADKRGLGLDRINLTVCYDPVGILAARGRLSAPWSMFEDRIADLVFGLSARGHRGVALTADGRTFHEAGASDAQELAAVLASLVQYLRVLEQAGLSLDAARERIGAVLVADADQFGTIAKFRALRQLWVRVEAACKLAPKPLQIHGETAWRSTSKRDPWVNMLRSTIATFAAGVGGADSISVLPFTAALGLPDSFARRVARNTQLVLLEEANLARVVDPSVGAGGIEALTSALAGKAWEIFQSIEAEGGMVAALQSGAVQKQIAQVRIARDKDIASRKAPITGTSEFPNIGEAPVTVMACMPPALSGRTRDAIDILPRKGERFGALVDAARAGATLGDLSPRPIYAPLHAEALPSRRSAEPFERLRDKADAASVRPVVFLAALGSVADFTARATFAKNFFEAGGLAAPIPEPFADTAALLAACKASGARLACLVGTDAAYGEAGPSLIAALKAEGFSVWVAGRMGEHEAALSAAGVSGSIYVGCDVVEALTRAQTIVGIG